MKIVTFGVFLRVEIILQCLQMPKDPIIRSRLIGLSEKPILKRQFRPLLIIHLPKEVFSHPKLYLG